MSIEAPKFIIRRLSEVPSRELPQVLDGVVRVEREAWPPEIQASREKFESRAQVFPEGFLTIAVEPIGIAGVSTGLIFHYNPNKPPISWEEITDNGWIKSTHTPDGNAIYIASVGATPRVRAELGISGVGSKLVEEQVVFARSLGKEYLVLGSRIPGYHEFHTQHPNIGIDEYVNLRRGEERFDPELRFYERAGLTVAKIVPNYMEDDPESENYGAVMVWSNKELLDQKV